MCLTSLSGNIGVGIARDGSFKAVPRGAKHCKQNSKALQWGQRNVNNKYNNRYNDNKDNDNNTYNNRNNNNINNNNNKYNNKK